MRFSSLANRLLFSFLLKWHYFIFYLPRRCMDYGKALNQRREMKKLNDAKIIVEHPSQHAVLTYIVRALAVWMTISDSQGQNFLYSNKSQENLPDAEPVFAARQPNKRYDIPHKNCRGYFLCQGHRLILLFFIFGSGLFLLCILSHALHLHENFEIFFLVLYTERLNIVNLYMRQ